MANVSRRAFLHIGLGFTAAGLSSRVSGLDRKTGRDPNRFALLSDLHVSPELWVARRADAAAKLRAALGEILAEHPEPAGIFACGDLGGRGADYAVLDGLLEPARARGVPVHLAIGNHDDRDLVRGVFGAPSDVPDRRAFVVESPHANWFVLDTMIPGTLAGEIGEAQLRWLGSALDARRDRHAFVLLHHPPEGWPDTTGFRDVSEFRGVLNGRRNVKALFFGHTHAWSVARWHDLWAVNVPSVAFSFNSAPTGWLDVRVGRHEVELALHGLDADRPGVLDRKRLTLR